MRIYKSMVRPSIEYCSPVWGGACETQLAALDAVQRRAVRIIKDSDLTNSLHSLQHRRDAADLSLFHRYYHGDCSVELHQQVPPPKVFNRASRSATRSHSLVVEDPQCTTSHFQNDFFNRTAFKWNRLDSTVFSDSLPKFKRSVHKYLPNNPLARLSNQCS